MKKVINFIKPILGYIGLYILMMITLEVLYGDATAEALKWYADAAVIGLMFLPKKKTWHRHYNPEFVKKLQDLRNSATDIAPSDPDEFIKWLNEEDEQGNKKVKIELAAQDKVDVYDKEIRMMLSYLLEPEDREIGETALITDESTIYDFFFDKKEEKKAIKRLNKELGKNVGIKAEDYLWVAVEKIKNEFPNWPESMSKAKLVK